MQRVKDYLVYLVVRILICIVQAMSMRSCHTLCRFLAFLATDVFRVRAAVIEDNLKNVFPDWSAKRRKQVTREMWEHLCLMVCEIAQIPRKIHDTNWRKYIHIHRKREMVRSLLDSRPTIIVSGHFGNFELANYSAGLLGISTFAIARKLDNPYLHRFITRFRGSKGQYMLAKDGSGDLVQQVISAGGKLALLGDQHAGPKGCWVDFLGRPASCHKAIAVFTISAGAPLTVAYAKRVGEPLHFEVGLQGYVDPEDPNTELSGVKPLTQWYNQQLEELIRETPEQYWWVHRRWKGEPPKRRRKKPTTPEPAPAQREAA